MIPKKFDIQTQRKYMRIPFKDHGRDFTGCDCGGLVWLLFKNELGIELPDWREFYSCTRIENAFELESTVSTTLGELCREVPFSDRKPFDVISLSIHGMDTHVGVVVDDDSFIHIMQGRTNVTVEKFSSPHWRNRVTGCFRYEG